jgi:uncharacterized membrane protein
LKGVGIAYLIANPILTVLLLLSALWLWRNPAALLVMYLTAIHVVFQAEPRYAIAYRPLECIVVVLGALLAWRAIQSLIRRVEPLQAHPDQPDGDLA